MSTFSVARLKAGMNKRSAASFVIFVLARDLSTLAMLLAALWLARMAGMVLQSISILMYSSSELNDWLFVFCAFGYSDFVSASKEEQLVTKRK